MAGTLYAALSRLAADARDAGSRLVVMLVLVLVAALLAVGGLAILFAALYLWLETLMPPALAALATAGAVFATALLLLLIGRWKSAPPRARLRGLGVATLSGSLAAGAPGSGPAGGEPPPSAPADLAAAVGSEIGLASAGLLRGHAAEVVITAAAAGFIVGVSPRLRQAIWRLLG